MSARELMVEHLESTVVQLDDWRQILRLAKTHSTTLGFLPDSAFADRLRKGTLVAARVDGEVVGYCLYDLPRAGHIKLVHVCVAGIEQGGEAAGFEMLDELGILGAADLQVFGERQGRHGKYRFRQRRICYFG